MNRAAVGLGSWLLQGAQNSRTVSLDTQDMLLELSSFERWQGEALEEDMAQGRAALRALVREACSSPVCIWQAFRRRFTCPARSVRPMRPPSRCASMAANQGPTDET